MRLDTSSCSRTPKPQLRILGLSMLLALVLFPGAAAAQTVRNLEFPVKLSEGAINDVIANQWLEEGWDSFSGNLLGCNYWIQVPAPMIQLNPGNAELDILFTAGSSNCPGGPWSFMVSPEVQIPSGQVTTNDVRMWLSDLLDRINALPIPQWLRSALILHFGPWADPEFLAGQIQVFPAQLLGDLTTDWFDQRSANLYYSNPFELGWQVHDGHLTLLPSVNLQAGQGATVGPDFKARLCSSNTTDYLDLWSNIKAEVKQARIFDIAGSAVYTVVDPGEFTIKYHGDPDEWISLELGPKSASLTSVYPTWILFETDNTFYLRTFPLTPGSCPFWTFASDGYNGI